MNKLAKPTLEQTNTLFNPSFPLLLCIFAFGQSKRKKKTTIQSPYRISTQPIESLAGLPSLVSVARNNWITVVLWMVNKCLSTCSWCVVGLLLLNTVCCGGMALVFVVVVVVVTEKKEEEEKEEEEQGRRDVKHQTPRCILDQTPWGGRQKIKTFFLRCFVCYTIIYIVVNAENCFHIIIM